MENSGIFQLADLERLNPDQGSIIANDYTEYVEDKRDEFNTFAPHYDFQTWITTMGRLNQLRALQADMAIGDASGKALELCCGTGGLTVELAKRFEKVVAVDLSPKMLSYAKNRAQSQGLRNIQFRECEISTVNFPDQSFASVSMSLGLHELPPWIREPLLRKAVRWVKPGGRFVICDYRKHDNWVGRFLMRVCKGWIEPKLFDEYIEFRLHERMSSLGMTRINLKHLFFSFLELASWTPSYKLLYNK
jgi:demethylmenaquinone methyltransferase/2-methoxy-6-polyprenyl-1,4-benzoquinol methylase